MINSTWLKTFSVLAETRSFTKTASQLNMTQPGVSQHIAKLEQYLGQELILREGKSFEITPNGYDVLQHANDLIRKELSLREQISDKDPHRGLCRISMPGGVGNLIYPWLIDLQVKNPLLKIHVEFNPTKEVERLVQANDCDIGLITHDLASDAIGALPFLNEKLWLVLPKGKDIKSFDELQELGFIDHPDGKKMAAKLLPLCFPDVDVKVENLNIAGYTNSAPKICEHVAAGVGYTVLDEFMVRVSPVFEALTVIDVQAALTDEIKFIHKVKWALHPRHKYVMEYLRKRALLYLEGKDRLGTGSRSFV